MSVQGRVGFFCDTPPNYSSFYPLPNAQATSVFLSICVSCTSLPGTKIGSCQSSIRGAALLQWIGSCDCRGERGRPGHHPEGRPGERADWNLGTWAEYEACSVAKLIYPKDHHNGHELNLRLPIFVLLSLLDQVSLTLGLDVASLLPLLFLPEIQLISLTLCMLFSVRCFPHHEICSYLLIYWTLRSEWQRPGHSIRCLRLNTST